jgi:hypothetical protein
MEPQARTAQLVNSKVASLLCRRILPDGNQSVQVGFVKQEFPQLLSPRQGHPYTGQYPGPFQLSDGLRRDTEIGRGILQVQQAWGSGLVHCCPMLYRIGLMQHGSSIWGGDR